MSDFIIEYEIGNVKNPRTREYLNEVISSYVNGNYRAAITTLYSVVMYDILHKVLDLKNLYGSVEAKEIIEMVDNQTNLQYGKQPQWELELISRVTEHFPDNKHDTKYKYLNFLDSHEYNIFDRLRRDRHKCAHPAKDSNYELRLFSKDDVRAHIRNMFEIVFTKDCISAINFCSLVDNDIELYKERLFFYDGVFESKNIVEIFKRRYFDAVKGTDLDVLFMHLFKSCHITSHETDKLKFSQLSLFLLLSLINDKRSECLQCFKSNSDNIIASFSYREVNIKYNYDCGSFVTLTNDFALLLHIFFMFPEFFKVLNAHHQEAIIEKSKTNINYFVIAPFLSPDLESHLVEAAELLVKLDRQERELTKDYRNAFHDYHKIDVKAIMKLYDEYTTQRNLIVKFVLNNVVNNGMDFNYVENILEKLMPHIITDGFYKEDLKKFVEIICTIGDYERLGGSYSYGEHNDATHYLNNYVGIIVHKLGNDYEYPNDSKIGRYFNNVKNSGLKVTLK